MSGPSLVISPVRRHDSFRYQSQREPLPFLRGRLSSNMSTGDSVAVGLFKKPSIKQVTEKLSPSNGEKSPGNVSPAQKEKDMRELRLKICTSPLKKSRSIEGKSRLTQVSSSLSALSVSTDKGKGNIPIIRSSTNTTSTAGWCASTNTNSRAISAGRLTRAKSSQGKNDGEGSESPLSSFRASSTTDIEAYRAAAHARIAKALEKQKQQREAIVMAESATKRTRGEGQEAKQKERKRYRAEIYAINNLLKKSEKANYNAFRKSSAALALENCGSDDDTSVDSDDSGSLGGQPSTPSTSSCTSTNTCKEGAFSPTPRCSTAGASLSSPTTVTLTLSSTNSSLASPSKFGGV
jgi:hypothetical protein